MKLDATKYRLVAKGLKDSFNNCKEKNFERRATVVAVSTHVPLICLLHILAEQEGYTDEINTILDKLMKFYKVSEVIL